MGGDARCLSYRCRYLDLRMAKIEAEHFILGFDNLVTRPDERLPSNWDVSAPPEPYNEEAELGDYIQAMLVDPTLERGAVV